MKFFYLFLLCLSSTLFAASPLPLWQLGVGLFRFQAPQYRGANQEKVFWLPFPAFVYRGENFKAEDNFFRAYFYRYERFSINISLAGQLPVSRSDNAARVGMPPLDTAIEIGPMFNYELLRGEEKRWALNVSLPIRHAWGVNFWHIESIGLFVVPFLALVINPQDWNAHTSMQFTSAFMWGGQSYHQYFYGVDPEYALSWRPSYKAHSGYSGQHWTWFINKKWDNFTSFFFTRYDRLQEAVFRNSPLVRRHDYFAFGLGLIVYFAHGDKKAD